MKRFLLALTLFIMLFVMVPATTDAIVCPGGEKTCGDKCIPKDNICLNLTYPKFGGLDLNQNQDLKSLATWVYAAIVIISGLAAFVMLVWGGITWMSSAGSPTAISDAKDRIQKALLGLLLVLASFLILQVINPELTVLKIPGAPAPKSTTAPTSTPKATDPIVQENQPTVDLKAEDGKGNTFAGSFTLGIRTDRRTVTFVWKSTNATKCITSGELPRVAIETQGSIVVPIPPTLALTDHTYTIQCENEDSGLLGEGNIVITMVR